MLLPFATVVTSVPVHHDVTLYSELGDWFAWVNIALLAILAAQWRDLQFDGPVLEIFLGTPGAPLILLQPDFPNLSHVFVGPIKSRGRFAPFRAIG
jgi:hypothetical protein